MFTRILKFTPMAALAALVVAGATVLSPGQAVAQSSTLVIRAGAGESGYAINQFLPNAVTVQAGDTVTWEFEWFEPHSVTFGPIAGDPSQPTHGSGPFDYAGGFASSGLVFGNPASPPTFSMTFTQPGTYTYDCIIHPQQTGTINVVASGATTSQAQADALGANVYTSNIAAIKAIAAQVGATAGAVTPKPTGGNKYSLIVGALSPAGDDAMQYFPGSVNIKTGDSIEWVSTIPVPHSVTFGEYPGGDPFAAPVTKPAATYDGTGYWDSGIIGIDFPNGTSFEMTFSKAGSYTYYCILHADQDMVGVVNVDTTATPIPPKTGAGLAEGGGTTAWSAWLAALGLAVIALGTGAVFITTRR